MNVAVVNTGPGVTWPTAIASSSCARSASRAARRDRRAGTPAARSRCRRAASRPSQRPGTMAAARSGSRRRPASSDAAKAAHSGTMIACCTRIRPFRPRPRRSPATIPMRHQDGHLIDAAHRRDEGDDAGSRQRGSLDGRAPEPDQRLRHDGDHDGFDSVQQRRCLGQPSILLIRPGDAARRCRTPGG